MKITKKKVNIQTPLVSPIMERPHEKILKKREYIAIKSHNTPGVNTADSMRLNSPIMEEDHLKSGMAKASVRNPKGTCSPKGH